MADAESVLSELDVGMEVVWIGGAQQAADAMSSAVALIRSQAAEIERLKALRGEYRASIRQNAAYGRLQITPAAVDEVLEEIEAHYPDPLDGGAS